MWARYASEQAERRKREALFRTLSLHTQRPTPAPTPSEPEDARDVFDQTLIDESFNQVKQAVGQEFKLMELSIHNGLGFAANLSTDGRKVESYRRPKGRRALEGPSEVQIIGDGDIKHSLFDPSAANLSLVPKLLEEAKTRSGLPDPKPESVRFNYPLIRYEGESPRWTVYVGSGEGDARQSKFVVFDAKGKFKEVF